MVSITHLVPYDGKTLVTTVTDSISSAERWLLNVKSSTRNTVVGINCQFGLHPAASSKSSKIIKLTLSVDTNCLVLQLLLVDEVPQSFKKLFFDPGFVFVGINMDMIVSKLESEYGISFGENKIDVRVLAKMHFPHSFKGRTGLKVIAHRLVKLGCLNLNVEDEKVVDVDRVECACVDAYACYRIGNKLLNEMK